MKKLSLNVQIWSVVACLILGTAAVSYIGITRLESFNRDVKHIVEDRAVKVEIANELQIYLNHQLYLQQSFILSSSAEEMKTLEVEIKETHEEVLVEIEQYRKIADLNGMATIEKLTKDYAAWTTLSEEIRKFALAGDDAKAISLFEEKGHDLRVNILDILEKAAERNKAHMAENVKAMHEDYEQAHKLIIMISVLAAAFSMAVAFVVLSRLSKNIKRIIESLSSGSKLVATASHQIASASEELAQASTEQASSLEEAVAALEEMNTMVSNNAMNARKASQLADDTRKTALQGEGEIRNLTASMQEISADSKRIEEIIHVIDDIAFQTNLLALNAAVEAARAGEQGKGFAVVAEAVRSLAQRSSLAAKDISVLIKSSVEKVSHKTSEVDHSASVLKMIVNSAKQVAVMNSEIAVACEDQASGIGQISKAMNQIDQVTQVNAVTSEEAAAAAQELSSQSNSMDHTVGVLVMTSMAARKLLKNHPFRT